MSTMTIDHPLDPQNATLSHAVVASPKLLNVYRGCINKTLHFIFTQSNALIGGSVPHNHITFRSRLPATLDNLKE
jgi:hypothetical protein